MAETEKEIVQYQKYLEKYLSRTPDCSKLVKVFRKLEKLGVTLDHLQVTGIGKTVNSYRKHDGEVGEKARELVAKWKDMVSRETSPAPSTLHTETVSENNVPSIQCETVSETHYRSNPHDSHKRAPYMHALPSGHEGSPSARSLTPDIQQSNRHKDKAHSSTRKHDGAEDKHTELKAEKKSKDSKDDRRSKHDKHKSSSDHSHKEKSSSSGHSEMVKKESSSHQSSNKHKHRDRESGKSTRESSQSSSSSRSTAAGKHSMDISDKAKASTKSPEHLGQDHVSKGEKASVMPNSNGATSKHKTANDRKKTGKEMKETEEDVLPDISINDDVDTNNDEEDDDNQGMSFEDFLNYDASLIKSKNKKKPTVIKDHKSKASSSVRDTTKSSKTGSKDDKLSKERVGTSSQSKHKDSHSKDAHKDRVDSKEKKSEKHHHGHKHKKHSRHEKEHVSSHSKSHKDEKHSSRHGESRSKARHDEDQGSNHDHKHLKRKAPESALQVPEPPKQMRLSTDDIMSSMTNMSTNYHPLPRQKLIDDTDMGQTGSPITSEDIGSKQYSKTAVYSGKKNISYLTAVPTLYDACMQILKDNIDALDYVGGVPYEILKPVLEICTPTQLYGLEDANPQFVGETDELWKKHSARDFRSARPAEFESWRELYLRKHDEREDKLKNLTASISATINKTKDANRTTKLAYVDVQAKAPRGVRRQQQKHGTGGPTGKVDPLAKLSSHGGSKDAPRAPIPRGIDAIAAPSSSRGSSLRAQQKAPKIIAPMMAKTLRFMKTLRRK